MKKVTVKFTVTTNNNYYFATSEKMMIAFCKENDFVIDRDYFITATSITEQNLAEKCGRGVYGIDASQYGH